MSRKLMLIAAPTIACLLTLCIVGGSSSQAFASGREAGHGPVRTDRGFGRDFRHFDRHFDRYGWNYGYFGYTVPVYETVTPVYETVAPVYETSEPISVSGNYGFWGYNGYWGHDHFRKDHNPPHRYQPLNSRGSVGHKG